MTKHIMILYIADLIFALSGHENPSVPKCAFTASRKIHTEQLNFLSP